MQKQENCRQYSYILIFFFWEIGTKNLTKTKFISSLNRVFSQVRQQQVKNAHGRTCKKTKVYISIYISLYIKTFFKTGVYIYIYYTYTRFQKGFHAERYIDRYILLFPCTCTRVHFSLVIVQLVKNSVQR